MPYNGEQVTCYFGDMSLKCNYANNYESVEHLKQLLRRFSPSYD